MTAASAVREAVLIGAEGESGGSRGPRVYRCASAASSYGDGIYNWGSPACAAPSAAPLPPRTVSSAAELKLSRTFLLDRKKTGTGDLILYFLKYQFGVLEIVQLLAIPFINILAPTQK